MFNFDMFKKNSYTINARTSYVNKHVCHSITYRMYVVLSGIRNFINTRTSVISTVVS